MKYISLLCYMVLSPLAAFCLHLSSVRSASWPRDSFFSTGFAPQQAPEASLQFEEGYLAFMMLIVSIDTWF